MNKIGLSFLLSIEIEKYKIFRTKIEEIETRIYDEWLIGNNGDKFCRFKIIFLILIINVFNSFPEIISLSSLLLFLIFIFEPLLLTGLLLIE